MTLFDPERGRPIVAPPCAGPGCWAGAPGAYSEGRDTYLVYRMRRPQPGRGYELRIAASHDGLRYETVWSAGKERFGAESIERCALARIGEGWRLYPSFVRRSDRRWCIGLIEARTVDTLDTGKMVVVLDPLDFGVAAVKDPWLRRDRGRWLMFVSYGTLPMSLDAGLHATGDALSTGRTLSASGVATSVDGRHWTWEGPTLWPSASGWDAYTARLTTAVRDGDGWLGLYDGSASLAENYEERCGLARSTDLRKWERISVEGPAIGTARGPGGVRYVDVTAGGDVFYEYTRPDGAHELRVTRTG
ncbi:MAG: hypothetical protein ACRDF9_06955 [Candidatus Limnocylindria bacterium]